MLISVNRLKLFGTCCAGDMVVDITMNMDSDMKVTVSS